MATTVQTTSYLADTASGTDNSITMPDLDRGVLSRKLLRRADPHLMHQRFGQQHPLGQRKGQNMVFRRYEKISTTNVPLSEGVTPTGSNLSTSEYLATIKQYGNYTIVSDFTDMTHMDPVISEATKLMGENMGESMDTVYREILVAGSTYYTVTEDFGTDGASTPTHSMSTARTGAAGVLNKRVVDAAIRYLRGKNASTFTPMIPGSTKVNTYPVGKAYWALMHPDMEHDLFSASGGFTLGQDFTPVERYSGAAGVMDNEVGKYRNVRFVTSTQAKVWTDGATSGSAGTEFKSTSGTYSDVYTCLIFARDAYAVVPLQRGSSKIILHKAGGPTDPLNQRNTVGWKAAGTACILNDEFMVRIQCCSAA